jgi:hypothetical protein
MECELYSTAEHVNVAGKKSGNDGFHDSENSFVVDVEHPTSYPTRRKSDH